VRVADNTRPLETCLLPFSRRLYPLPDQRRTLAQPVAAQFFVVHARDFDVDVDAVKHRTGDTFLVFGHRSRRAGTGLLRVAVIATRAWITHKNTDFSCSTIGNKVYLNCIMNDR
jgi:hypothetical protein